MILVRRAFGGWHYLLPLAAGFRPKLGTASVMRSASSVTVGHHQSSGKELWEGGTFRQVSPEICGRRQVAANGAELRLH